MTTQIVTISFFRYTGWANRWWAFQLMGRGMPILTEVPGLRFAKLLGSGGGNGFSIWPNFGTYGLLNVWDTEREADHFFKTHTLFKDCKDRASRWWTTYMQTAKSHGQWDGDCPFEDTVAYDKDRPVGVITRATIAPRKLWQFWRFVPAVGRAVSGEKGLIFSVGIGELPLIQQATFSLWENSHEMMQYAYQSRYHKEVVRKTRELNWYTEELFARFHPYRTEGNWQNDTTPIKAYL